MINRSKVVAVLSVLFALILATFLLTTPRERMLLTNTLLLSGAVIAISIPIGSLIGVLATRTDLPGRKLFYIWIAIALLTPLHLQAAAWQMGIGIQGWFSAMFIDETAWWFDGWFAAIWVHSFAAIPWVAWIVSLAAVRTSRDVEEAALLESSPRTVFSRILLPQLLPALGLAALLVIVQTSTEISVTDFFRVRTWAEEVYTQATGTSWVEVNANADTDRAWGFLHPVTFVLIAAGFFVMTRILRAGTELGLRAVQKPLIYSWNRWRWLAGTLWIGLFLFAVGVPMLNLVIKTGIVVEVSNVSSVPEQTFVSSTSRSWSVAKFFSQLASALPRYQGSLGTSLVSASCATTIAVALSITLQMLMHNIIFKQRSTSRFAARFTSLWLNPGTILAAVLAMLPAPVVGLALIKVFREPNLPMLDYLYGYSLAGVIAAQALRIFPWCWLIIAATWPTVGRSQLEIARLEGASRLTILRRIIAPQLWPAWCAALIVGFELALGELAATLIIYPPGWLPFSVQIFGLLHSDYQPEVASICLLLFFFHAIGVLTVARLMKVRSSS